MNNTINSDLIRGNIDTIILRALYGGDRYGYDIIKEIEQRSSGKYKLKQPTLYSCLNRLEVQGFVRSYWGAKSIGGRRKYYTLTDMGKELFIKNRTDWEYSKSLIDNLITEQGETYQFDLEEENTSLESLSDDSSIGDEIAAEENAIDDELEAAREGLIGDKIAAGEATIDNELEVADESSIDDEIAADETTIDNELEVSDESSIDDEIEAAEESTVDDVDKVATDVNEDECDEYTYAEKEAEIEQEEADIALKSANLTDEENDTNEKSLTYVDSKSESEQEDAWTQSPDSAAIEEYLELDESENLRALESLMHSNDSNNYIDKIQCEKYVPDKNIYTEEHLRTETYFKDFEDEDCFDEDEDENSEQQVSNENQQNTRNQDLGSSAKNQNDENDGRFYVQNQSAQFNGRSDQGQGAGEFNERFNYQRGFDFDGNQTLHQQRNQGENSRQLSYREDFATGFRGQHDMKDERFSALRPVSVFDSNPHREEKKPSDSFISYKSDAKKLIPLQKDTDRKPSPEIYRIFEEKLAGIKKQADSERDSKKPTEYQTENAYVARVTNEQIADRQEPEFLRKDQIQIRNFKRLQDSAADMGEEIKIRSYENNAAKEFNEQYYFYSNRLKLKQYFILFCFVLVEVVLCYIAINLGLHKNMVVPTSDLMIYISAVLVGLIFPTSAFLQSWSNPNKRKRISYSFAMQMTFGIIIMVQLMLIIYFLNVYFKMPLTLDKAHYTSLIMPIVMCLNIPINTIIFNILFKSKKYAV